MEEEAMKEKAVNDVTMQEETVNQEKQSKDHVLGKLVGACILVAVAIYFIPQVRQVLTSAFEGLADEWRKAR